MINIGSLISNNLLLVSFTKILLLLTFICSKMFCFTDVKSVIYFIVVIAFTWGLTRLFRCVILAGNDSLEEKSNRRSRGFF